MRQSIRTGAMFATTTMLVAALWATAQPESAAATTAPSVDLRLGWKLLKEGSAEGKIEQDSPYPGSDKPHLLRIEVTNHPGPGEGRAGAANDIGMNVEAGHWYDITFSSPTGRASIGLVFSLESADGRVLARTTLPEVGRQSRRPQGPDGAPATRPAASRWANYLVSLHARGTDPSARLVIHPIEPANVWLENLTLTARPTSARDSTQERN